MGVIFDLFDEPLLFETGDNLFARLETVEPGELAGVFRHPRAFIQYGDELETVPFARREIIRIVGWGNLDDAATELRIGEFVADHAEFAADQRQANGLVPKVLVALVAGVDGDRGVADHGLGTGRGDDNIFVPAGNGVANMPEMPLLLLVDDFEIGNRGLATRTPVDEIFPAKDQTFLIQAHECFAYGPGKIWVHRKMLARPVTARADTLQLPDDRATVLLLPGPNVFEELLAPDLAPLDALFAEMAFDEHLRGDAGVVGAGQPEHIVSQHPPPSHTDIGLRDFIHVPHVERAGHIGRRNHQRIGRFVALGRGDKEFFVYPPLGPVRFKPARFVDFI